MDSRLDRNPTDANSDKNLVITTSDSQLIRIGWS